MSVCIWSVQSAFRSCDSFSDALRQIKYKNIPSSFNGFYLLITNRMHFSVYQHSHTPTHYLLEDYCCHLCPPHHWHCFCCSAQWAVLRFRRSNVSTLDHDICSRSALNVSWFCTLSSTVRIGRLLWHRPRFVARLPSPVPFLVTASEKNQIFDQTILYRYQMTNLVWVHTARYAVFVNCTTITAQARLAVEQFSAFHLYVATSRPQ